MTDQLLLASVQCRQSTEILSPLSPSFQWRNSKISLQIAGPPPDLPPPLKGQFTFLRLIHLPGIVFVYMCQPFSFLFLFLYFTLTPLCHINYDQSVCLTGFPFSLYISLYHTITGAAVGFFPFKLQLKKKKKIVISLGWGLVNWPT